MRAWPVVALLWWTALGLLGCGPRDLRPAHDPGQLVDTSALPWRFMARQRVQVIRGQQRQTFDAVLQHDDALILVVLTPFAAKAFVITQRGREVNVQMHADMELPIAPRDILLDVHRALFIGASQPRSDGLHRMRREGERIEEAWLEGRLQRRTFERERRGPRGTIVIDYAGGWRPGEVPPRIDFAHGWFGYALTIETLAYTPL